MNPFTEAVDPDETSLEALIDRYADRLTAVAESIDRSDVTEAADLNDAALRAAETGAVEQLTLTAAVTLLALEDGVDPDGAIAAVRDHLLLAMSGAMIDVETLARSVEADMEPGEIQAKVEGRHPMTVDEYARLQHAIARHGG